MISSEFIVLRMLMDSPSGLYGSDFVDLSEGSLKRSSIYVVLQRMEEKKLVTSKLIPANAPDALPRRRYRICAHGQQVFHQQLNRAGLALASPTTPFAS
jgi:DNA-binding PadR family transcriptional regulator